MTPSSRDQTGTPGSGVATDPPQIYWVAVSGASGFIGRGLCPALQQAGYGVIVLSRDPEAAQSRLTGLNPALTRFCDYRHLDSLQPQALINLAGANIGAKRWSPARKKELLASRIDTTEQLMHAAQQHWQHHLQVVISGSAVGFYGDVSDRVLDELSPGGDDFAARLCQRWEAAANSDGQNQFRRVIIRLGIVLGPPEDGGALAVMKLPFSLGLGASFGNGRQWQSWISRNDAVRAMLHLLATDDLAGVFNLTSPNPVSNRDFTRGVATALHRPAFLFIPRMACGLLFGEMQSLLLASQRVLPQALLASGFEFQQPTLAPALAAAFYREPGSG